MTKGYLGLGAQRKGENLPNIILGWFYYEGPASAPKLTFDGADLKTSKLAVEQIGKVLATAHHFFGYYSERGSGFYLVDEYEKKFGLISEERGRMIPYDEDTPDPTDTTSTRLAVDVAALRIVERDYPDQQFIDQRGRIREKVRMTEINDEPGRGPIRRFLSRVQGIQPDFIPSAAMAFQALRRAWVEYDGDEEAGQIHSPLFETKTGTFFDLTQKGKRPEQAEALPDPQYSYGGRGAEFIDYEDQGTVF